jgi:C-terminal processing protease CtpA/Prc
MLSANKIQYTFIFFVCAVMMVSCSASLPENYSPVAKLAPDKLKEDALLLKKIFEANHPGLYWYTSKDSMDVYFNNLYNGIKDSLTEKEFRNRVAIYIAQIHCGHTAVYPSKNYLKYYSQHASKQFPLVLKAKPDSLIVIGSLFVNDSIFKPGIVVTSINGHPTQQIFDSLFQYISTDGYADVLKYQLISFNFPVYYRNSFGLDSIYKVTYIDTAGNSLMAVIKNYDVRTDSIRIKMARAILSPTKKQLRKLKTSSIRSVTYDTAMSMAYMRITAFAGDGMKKFFKHTFKTIKSNNIQNLVIDLRENGGGNVAQSIALTKYVTDSPFHFADTAAAFSRSFPYGKYINSSFFYRMIMRFTTVKRSDERFHFKYLEKHVFHPKKNNHFDGHIYVLQSGFTFSAASMFIANIKDQSNVTLVGEETGGSSYGDNAIHLPRIVLPYSGLHIILPVYRVVMNSNKPKTGRGIMPNIYASPTSYSIAHSIDAKMEAVKQLIKEKKQ